MAEPYIDRYQDNGAILDETWKARPNIYESRLRLLHRALTTKDPGKILSIGIGSGIFETLLRERYGIEVAEAVEPSASLGAEARKKGLHVTQSTAQDYDYAGAPYDTIVYNGSSFGFIPDDEIEATFAHNREVLADGGRLVLTDVPEESALGIILQLAQKYDIKREDIDDLLAGTTFFNLNTHAYKPNWHPISWYAALLERIGYRDLKFFQTVLANPPYQKDAVEDPIEGYTKGNYVAIVASK
ncbi:class I SAM-dependent methyltransferase [Bifidobacterium felsineum]|uniref:class I SAM-dependent methyltransferase n=1 Tax=Bifidobacterium felsineum TaxID=2045440 RepID=UPI001BDBE98F|nr:class I SAM-dependent methyltransferase [Bifidobacterium felsineum]MBT1164533.1 class I SAM-dependent methyltransferase [Bifidobacterium felsineum]